jgi:hypothetical protein
VRSGTRAANRTAPPTALGAHQSRFRAPPRRVAPWLIARGPGMRGDHPVVASPASSSRLTVAAAPSSHPAPYLRRDRFASRQRLLGQLASRAVVVGQIGLIPPHARRSPAHRGGGRVAVAEHEAAEVEAPPTVPTTGSSLSQVGWRGRRRRCGLGSPLPHPRARDRRSPRGCTTVRNATARGDSRHSRTAATRKSA